MKWTGKWEDLKGDDQGKADTRLVHTLALFPSLLSLGSFRSLSFSSPSVSFGVGSETYAIR